MADKVRGDGEGSVYCEHVKDCSEAGAKKPKCKCKWRGAYVIGHRNGRPVRKRVTAPNRAGALRRLEDVKDKHKAHALPKGKTPTVEQWLNHCHSTLLRRGKRPLRESSLVNYRGVMGNYLIPLLGHQRLDRLTADDIENAWHILAETGNPLLGAKAKPLSPSTVHHAHVVLARCLQLALRKKHITLNPAGRDSMDAPSKGSEEVEPLAEADWKRILELAADAPNAARWTVALALGLRQGEATGLRWEDVDLDAGTLRIRQTLYRLPARGIVYGEPKTERAKRTIALPGPLVLDLRRHRKAQNEARMLAGDHWRDLGLVFTLDDGRPLDPSVDRRRWRALLAKAGVNPIKLHAARHTAATTLLLRGVDPRIVMDIMGWSQISTAANYQHAVSEAKRAAADVIGAAVWG